MHLFLTSSPSGCPYESGPAIPVLDGSNDFVKLLRRVWPAERPACLILSATPGDHWGNDQMREAFEACFANAGLPFKWVALCDDRDADEFDDLLSRCQVVLLCGGHVPTQQAFLQSLGAVEALAGYKGVVIAMSAGSMNCADPVYSQPEDPGEGTDSGFERWLPGLGLTETCIIPHFQKTRTWMLDGLRLVEDITLPDSHRHPFIALADGSYIYAHGGHETLYGQAWLMAAGQLLPLCENGRSLRLK